MAKQKLKAVSMNLKGGMQIINTIFVDSPQVCKNCKKNPRDMGSSHCGRCSNAFKILTHQRARLEEKVERQADKLIA